MRLALVALLGAVTNGACGLFATAPATTCAQDSACPANHSCRSGVCVRTSVADASATPDVAGGDRDGGSGTDRPAHDVPATDARARDVRGNDARGNDARGSDGAHRDAPGVDGSGTDAGVQFALFAIYPSIGKVGDAVHINGIFPLGEFTIYFGSTSIQVSVVGSTNNFIVSVPVGATTGDVYLMQDGRETARLPFRVTTFDPRLGTFASEYEQTTAACEMPVLDRSRFAGFAQVIGRDLYLFGGVQDNRSPQVTQRAHIHADGTLGPFELTAGNDLVSRRANATPVRIGNRLYVIGGVFNSATLATIEVAAIGNDGTLAPFNTAPVSLLRQDATAVVLGPYLYVLSGRSGPNPENGVTTISRATIAAAGSLSAFTTYSRSTTVQRDRAAAAVIGARVYLFGGTGSNQTAEWASFDSNGDLGDFTQFPLVGWSGGRSAGLVVFPREVCAFGGETNDNPETEVACAPINEDGSLGDFSVRGALRTKRAYFAHALVHDRVYAIGGSFDGNTKLTSVEQAPITLQTTFANFDLQPSSCLPVPLRCPACAVAGNFLYLTGGDNSPSVGSDPPIVSKAIVRFPILADGALGPYDQSFGVELDQPRSLHRMLLLGNKLCALGGASDVLWTELATIVCSDVDAATGDLGTFAQLGMLPAPRSGFTAIVARGQLFVGGGWDNVGFSDQTAFLATPLHPTPFNGWTQASRLYEARGEQATALIGDRVYVLGGLDSWFNTTAGIESAPLTATGVDPFVYWNSSLPDNGRHDAATFVLGDNLYWAGGTWTMEYSDTIHYANVLVGQVDATGGLASMAVLRTGVPAASAECNCTVVLDNYVHILGGWDGVNNSAAHFSAVIQ